MIFPVAYPTMHFLPILILPDGPFNSKVLHSRELLCYSVYMTEAPRRVRWRTVSKSLTRFLCVKSPAIYVSLLGASHNKVHSPL